MGREQRDKADAAGADVRAIVESNLRTGRDAAALEDDGDRPFIERHALARCPTIEDQAFRSILPPTAFDKAFKKVPFGCSAAFAA
jgi:hypothetical protein